MRVEASIIVAQLKENGTSRSEVLISSTFQPWPKLDFPSFSKHLHQLFDCNLFTNRFLPRELLDQLLNCFQKAPFSPSIK